MKKYVTTRKDNELTETRSSTKKAAGYPKINRFCVAALATLAWFSSVSMDFAYGQQQDSMETVQRLLQAGEVRKATDAWRQYLEKNPQDRQSGREYMDFLARQGKEDEAIKIFERGWKKNPEDPVAIYLYARALRYTQIKRSAELLERALSQFPGDYWVHIGLGSAYLAQRKTKEAETMFTKAIELDPKQVVGYQNLASLMIMSGNIPKAMNLQMAALKVDPQNVDSRLMLSELYTHLGRLSIAKAGLEEIQKLRPGHYQSGMTLGWVNKQIEAGRKAAKEGKRHLRHCMVKTEEQAEKVDLRLAAGEDFIVLALQFSQAPNRTKGGDMGWTDISALRPSFQETVRKLNPGDHTPRLQDENGYHWFYMEKPEGP